jgi:hypothetical protein
MESAIASIFAILKKKTHAPRANFTGTIIGNFCDSHFYNIHGGFIAEVISHPYQRFMHEKQLDLAGDFFLKLSSKIFSGHANDWQNSLTLKEIKKNIFEADWLILLSFNGNIIGYTTATWIDRNYIYINAACLLLEYSKKAGLGGIQSIILYNFLLKYHRYQLSREFKFIARTRNREVVKLFEHMCQEVKISFDSKLSKTERKEFSHIAEKIHSPFDEKTGLIKNIYSGGFPTGNSRRCLNLQAFFSNPENSKDAFFISGRPDYFMFKWFFLSCTYSGKTDIHAFDNDASLMNQAA